jgi:hypothetical protein
MSEAREAGVRHGQRQEEIGLAGDNMHQGTDLPIMMARASG